MMNITLFALFLFSSIAWSKQTFEEKYFNDRKEMVKALKEFIKEAEEKHGLKITFDEVKKKWVLIDEAWANDTYNCFYGGWPSVLVASNGKRYCQKPQKVSGAYDQGSCGVDELRCQPQLFGKNICVSFKTTVDKQIAFSNCEKKFLQSSDKDYGFTKNFGEEDFHRLREIAAVAENVCEGKVGIQKGSPMCIRLNEKLKKHFKSFYLGTELKTTTNEASELKSISVNDGSSPSDRKILLKDGPSVPKDCDVCQKKVNVVPEVVNEHDNQVKKITDGMKDEVTLKYERMKGKFLNSDFCDPKKMFAQGDDPNPLLMSMVSHGTLKKMLSAFPSPPLSTQQRMETIAPFLPKGGEVYDEIKSILEKVEKFERLNSNDANIYMVSARVQVFKRLQEAERDNPEAFKEHYLNELSLSNIFDEDERGITCPFPSEDAFRKAVTGYNKLKSGKDVSKKDQLTIVDYSMPSNHRRMFVMDMKDEEVIHNTWTAHGSGGRFSGEEETAVEFSRKSGSNLTREGFMVAGSVTTSPTYGKVLYFKGKDLYNSYSPGQIDDKRMFNDKVWLHAWGAPALTYLSHKEEVRDSLDVETDPSRPGYNYSSVNLANSRIIQAGTLGKRLGMTYGCLGVPEMPIKALDKKGRDKNQFELLKEDLPGSVLFAYSGPDQKSHYLP